MEVLRAIQLKSKRGLLKDEVRQEAEFIGLSILDKFVANRWTNLGDEEKSRVRSKLLEISTCGIDRLDEDMVLVSSLFSIRKLCRTFSRVIIQDYFASWKAFLESILDHRSKLFCLERPAATLTPGSEATHPPMVARNISILTKLVLGITKEISETLLINSNANELNSKMRASSTNGLCNEIEPILYIISSELQNACCFKDGEPARANSNLDISLVKQSLGCLKNLAKIIDSGKLLNLRLDELLITLHNTGLLDNNEEILDLLDSLVQNLTKQKKGAVFILEYQDLNRLVLGVSNLVKNTVLNPSLFSKDPDYDTSLTHLNWMKLFKDVVEGCTPALLRIPDNVTLEKSVNKMQTVTLVWETALVLCIHPCVSVCDLAVSSLCQILKILAKELPSLSKDCSKHLQLAKDFQSDVLLVFLFVRSLRIGDPKINYLTEEWNPWNVMISNMVFNSLAKLNSESLNIPTHFPNQPFNFSLIATKYFKLIDEYNIVDCLPPQARGFGGLQVSEYAPTSKSNNLGSFNNSYSSLKNRVIQLVNSLVDFGQGILLDQLLETCLNIAMLIFSSQPFNSKCTQHQSLENYSNSPQILCQKWIFIDGICLIFETILNRIDSNIHNLPENEPSIPNPRASSCGNIEISSFLDILNQNADFRQRKVWISSLFKLMNGILQLSLLERCGNFLESRRLTFISQTPLCIEWYRDLFHGVDSMITIDGILHIYLYYLSSSEGPRIPDLRKTAANCLSRILLNNPQLFEPKLQMIIQVINQGLNDPGICFEEKTVLNSVLIAATNAVGDFNRIMESCEMTSKAALSLLSRDHCSLGFSNREEVLEFFFRDLINTVKASKEPSEYNWENLTLFKNSLTLLFSLFVNVRLPDELSSLKDGGFLKKEKSHLILRHPLENVSRQLFETICLVTLNFLQICDYNSEYRSEDLNIASLFNSISDQEWVARSGDIKNQSELKIIKLSKITSYRMIFHNSFLQLRRLTYSIRNLLIKLLVSIFTLGTYKDLGPQDQNNVLISNPGLYFEEENVCKLLNTLMNPIRTFPLHIFNFVIKNGWSIIFSPETLPRFQDGHSTNIFLEEVFSHRFAPAVIEKLRSEWQNLMASHAFILSSTISESKDSSFEHVISSVHFQDPFRVLLNVNTDFKDFPSDLQDNSLYNVIYNSHYNDLSETSLAILKIVDKFILSINRQQNYCQSSYKSRNGPKHTGDQVFKLRSGISNEDFQMDYLDGWWHDYQEDHQAQGPLKGKVQPKHVVLSQMFLLNQNLMRSCLDILVEFLSFPDPNVLETSLHIIQRYLQQYINFTSQPNLHSKYSHIHVLLIKNLLIQLLKVGPIALPFDPLNLSPSRNENIKITTPLNSYIKLNHPSLLKNTIVDCILSIIRSDPDCLNFINNVKNELSKNSCNTSSSSSFNSNCSFSSDLQVPLPDEILEKAYNCLEFLFSKHFEYLPSGSEGIFSQQDIILICKTFLQEHVLDTLSSPSSVLSNLIGNVLEKLSQISFQNEQNPYIANLNTFIKPSFQQ